MQEIWKDINGYEGVYQVSNLGRIKSLPRKVPFKDHYLTVPLRILKTTISNTGYVKITLQKTIKQKHFMFID